MTDTDTTTIEIRTEQKAVLDDLKTVPRESYKSVIGRLIDDYNVSGDDGGGEDVDGDALAEDVATRTAERVVDALEGRR